MYKHKSNKLFIPLLGGLTAAQLAAGTFNADFNSGTPAGMALYGTAAVVPSGGVGGTGYLKLTTAGTGQAAGVVLDDLDGGAPIYGFNLHAKVRVGGGTSSPADGFSISFAPDLPAGTWGEEGAGSGFTIAFDLYDNGGGEAPSIDAKVGGNVVASRKLTIPQIITGSEFADLHVELEPSGVLNLTYKGMEIFSNLMVPGYQPLAGQFGFGARTGGATANQWFDDLSITTSLVPESAFSTQPKSVKSLPGRDVTFSAAITNPEGATYQWYKNDQLVPGATDASYTVPTVVSGDSGSKYKVMVDGPNNDITSDEVTLTVVDIPPASSPNITFDFNDGAVPAGTYLVGWAVVELNGGVNDSGVLKLTIPDVIPMGGLVIEDTHAGAPVYGFTAQMDVRIGGGTAPPADGMSFSFTPTVNDPLPGDVEEGVGGLAVAFDIYDNGGGEAPSIDIKNNGTVIASAKVPLSLVETGDEYGDVIIRMQTDGTMDVAFRGTVVHDNVLVPGFTSVSGGQFVLAARTGGLTANQWVDNIRIDTELTSGNFRIASQPASTTALVGRTATFTSDVNDANGVTYQWLRNDQPISGQTSPTLTIDPVKAEDQGATYRLRATKGNSVVTSDPATLSVVNLTAPTSPTVSYDFNDAQIPAGTAVFGTAFVDSFGGVGDSGVLKVTINENSQSGAFVINPILGGAELSALSAAFDVRIGGGSGNAADGISFNWSPTLPNGTLGDAEEGTGGLLTITFDIYDNGGGEAPSIDIKWKGATISQTKLTKAEIETGDEFRTVLLEITEAGKISLAYGDRVIANGLQLPNYTFTSNGKFGFYARTGGENENQWVDNIRIFGTKSTAPLRVTTEPADALVLAGSSATFNVALSDPNGATYQWYRGNELITGATSASYTTPALTSADNGTLYSVRATGTGGNVTSRSAMVTVVAPIIVTNPNIDFNFDDGMQPEGTFVNGTAFLEGGFVRLTESAGGQQGTFVITDRNNGEAVSGFTATFGFRLSDPTSPPADGAAFVWGDDIGDTSLFGEEGTGSGLIIAFDIFDNGGGEAPAVDISYKGEAIASRKVPLSLFESGSSFSPVAIRVEPDGTLDVQYDGQIIYNNLQLPNFTPVAGASFAWGARTGGLWAGQYIDDIKIATGTSVVGPTLNIAKSGNNVTLSWTGPGVLQARDSLSTGNWEDVATTNNTITVPTDRPSRFFRVIVR